MARLSLWNVLNEWLHRSHRWYDAVQQDANEDSPHALRREIVFEALVGADPMAQRPQRPRLVAIVQIVPIRVRLPHVVAQRRRVRIARTLAHDRTGNMPRAFADDDRDAVTFEFKRPAFGDEALKDEIVRKERDLHTRLLLARSACEVIGGLAGSVQNRHEARCGCGKWFLSRGVPAPRI